MYHHTPSEELFNVTKDLKITNICIESERLIKEAKQIVDNNLMIIERLEQQYNF